MKEGTPSQTALRMLLVRLAAARDPELRKLIPDPEEPYSEWFAREHSSGARVQLALWKWGPTRRFFYNLGDRVIPGTHLHVLVRKRYVEEAVRSALVGGAVQMVTLGAGLDPLALRLQADFPAVTFFELDHPSTQGVKQRVIAARRIHTPRVHLAPIDLENDSLEERLAALPGFRSGEKTLFLAEGLLMYLEDRAVDAVFAAVRRHSGPDSRFIFSVLDGSLLADPDTGVARSARVLQGMGEPIRSSVERKRLDDYLRHHGFKRRAVGDYKTFLATYVKPLGIQRPLLEGEYVVTAEPTNPGR